MEEKELANKQEKAEKVNSEKATDIIIVKENEIGKEKLVNWTGNIAFPGFTAPKILWVKENEKEYFAKIKKIMFYR